MYTGPRIVTDGLVFGYDTGHGVADNNTATRFYPGEPTANILSNTVDFNNWTSARNSGSYPTVTANTSANPLGKSYEGMADKVYIPEDGAYPRIQQYFTPSSTNTHTFSVWIRSLSGDCDCFLGAFRNSPWSLPGHSVKSITSEWQRFTFSWTPPDTTTHVIYMGSHDTAAQKGNTLEFWGAQIEQNSHNTPYTPGSRSSTASLIDLKNTTDIDVSNVSFDSTGQPIFDGTDDKIVIADQTSITAYTYETVVKINTADSSYSGFGSNYKSDASGYSGVGNGWVLRLDPSGNLQIYTKNNSTTLINPINISGFRANNSNKYIHLVYTYEDGSNKLYLNGALQQTGTGLSGETASDSTLIIGAYSWGIATQTYYLNGHQPVAKLYNTTLSADEVKQNYNAYKNRFNI